MRVRVGRWSYGKQNSRLEIKLAIALTDGGWFGMLRKQPDLGEICCAPSAASYRALRPGELI